MHASSTSTDLSNSACRSLINVCSCIWVFFLCSACDSTLLRCPIACHVNLSAQYEQQVQAAIIHTFNFSSSICFAFSSIMSRKAWTMLLKSSVSEWGYWWNMVFLEIEWQGKAFRLTLGELSAFFFQFFGCFEMGGVQYADFWKFIEHYGDGLSHCWLWWRSLLEKEWKLVIVWIVL